MPSAFVDIDVPAEVQLVVDRFVGEGADGQLVAHLSIDHDRGQTVTFVLSDADRNAIDGLGTDEVSGFWRDALGEMAQRLAAELSFTGPRGLSRPITVQSRLRSVTAPAADIPWSFAEGGALLAHFAM